jgi:hypothetical protein
MSRRSTVPTSVQTGIVIIAAVGLIAGCSKARKSSAEIDLVPGEPEHAAPLAPAGDAPSPAAASDRGAASISWEATPPRHGNLSNAQAAASPAKAKRVAPSSHAEPSGREPAAHAKRSATTASKRRPAHVERSRADAAVNPK